MALLARARLFELRFLRLGKGRRVFDKQSLSRPKNVTFLGHHDMEL